MNKYDKKRMTVKLQKAKRRKWIVRIKITNKSKVYIVVYDGAYGIVIESVFFNKGRAQKCREKLQEKYHYAYRIIEREVD